VWHVCTPDALREESASGRTPAGQVLDGSSGPSSWIGKAREWKLGARSTARYKAHDGTGRRYEPRTLRRNLPRECVMRGCNARPCGSVDGWRVGSELENNLTCARQGLWGRTTTDPDCGPCRCTSLSPRVSHHRPRVRFYMGFNSPNAYRLLRGQAGPALSFSCRAWCD
jgi:hypothetical protein